MMTMNERVKKNRTLVVVRVHSTRNVGREATHGYLNDEKSIVWSVRERVSIKLIYMR